MKVKELDRTVNVAWSPPAHHPILLATGTAAQQLDASFNTSAALELYALNLAEPGLDMELKISVPSQQRFHKVAWGGSGAGVIVGGCDNGKLQMHSVSKLLTGEDGLLTNQDRHTGSVRSLDFNPFQTNLLASGASESEIYIWDLNNTSTPMTPGAKPQPYEDVVWLAWNKQVQHILASTFPTRCIVWDLRKNEPIIKLSDSTSRVRWKVVAWHPDVATQLCLASEDDANPVVQLWDLRFATSPLKSLQAHSRGVLTLAWCNQDPDLLISSGKDNRILCWNPNSQAPNGEIVCEIANNQQVIFEVSWCPRNPSLIASCSCDGHTSIYSLTGSQNQVQTSTKIADSFPGMENMSGSEPPAPQHQATVDLRKPPKWLRRPVGASFGFGGKLVSFGQEGVVVRQVSMEDDLLSRAREVEECLEGGRAAELCKGRADPVWAYLEASFAPDPRSAFRTLLGYEHNSVKNSIGKPVNMRQNCDVDALTDHMSALNQNFDGVSQDYGDNSESFGSYGGQNGAPIFEKMQMPQPIPEKKIPPFRISTGNDVNGSICKALLVGGIEEAVDLCLEEKRMADAIILAIAAGPELLAKTQVKYFQESDGYLSHLIKAVVMEDWKGIVSSCELSSWKEALAAVLTYCKEEELPSLCEELGSRLEAAGGVENQASAEICYIASGNLGPLIEKRTASSSLTAASIQELVELVLVSEQALRSKGGSLPSEESAIILSLYAELLASQGDLQTALRFISNINHVNTEELKERLYYALGHKSIYQQTQQQLPQQGYGRKPSLQGGASQMPAKPPTPGVGVGGYQPAVAPMGQAAQMAPFGRAPPPGPPPPTAPPLIPRNTPSPHQTQGKKYVVDPSVQGGYRNTSSTVYSPGSASLYQQQPQGSAFAPGAPVPLINTAASTFVPPGSSTFPPQPAAPTGFAPAPPGSTNFSSQGPTSFAPPGSSSFPPQPLGSSSFPPGPFSAPPVAPVSNFREPPQGPTGFAPSGAPGFPPASSTFQPPPQTAAPPPQRPTPPPPAASQFQPQKQTPATFGQPPETGKTQPLTAFNPPTFQPQQPEPFNPNLNKPSGLNHPSAQTNNTSAPGWNDPPVISGHPRNQPKAEVPQQAPITHPLFGSAPPEQTPPNYGGGYGAAPPPQQSFGQPPLMPQPAFAPPPQTFSPPPPSSAPTNRFQPTQFQPQQAGINGGYGEAPREEKPPLPPQYAHMQSVFQNLRDRASVAATNPQLKRKLDEVGRKLETLYDSLRDSRLSMDTVGSLEQMAGLLERGEYREALDLHTKMASGADFSQIASFMPGLKALIQSSLQLGVYLQ